ncbi:MAG: 30S ribosomal protein S27ae, partial [Archaeoglobaceae archaeon]
MPEVVSRFYEIKGEKIVRKRKFCPRCGEGVFLAE